MALDLLSDKLTTVDDAAVQPGPQSRTLDLLADGPTGPPQPEAAGPQGYWPRAKRKITEAAESAQAGFSAVAGSFSPTSEAKSFPEFVKKRAGELWDVTRGIFSPVQAAAGVAVGVPVEMAAEYAGASPETAQTVGNLAEFVVPVATAKLVQQGVATANPIIRELIGIPETSPRSIPSAQEYAWVRGGNVPVTPTEPNIADLARTFRAEQAEGAQLFAEIDRLRQAGLPVPRQLQRAADAARARMNAPAGAVPPPAETPVPAPGVRGNLAPSNPTGPAPSGGAPAPTGGAVRPTEIRAPLMEERVASEATGAVAEAAKNTAKALETTTAAKEGKRLFRQVAEALDTGQIQVEGLPELLQRSGMSLTQFVEEYAQTISESGRTLQHLSRLRRHLNKLGEYSPETADALRTLDAVLPADSWWQRFLYGRGKIPGYVQLDDLRRAALTAQVKTGMRNILSQTGNYALHVLDTAVQQTVGGKTAGDATEMLTALGRVYQTKNIGQINAILEQFPEQAKKLASAPGGEATLGQTAAKLMGWLNNFQESFFRRAMFDAEVRNGLRQRGLNVERYLEAPQYIPEEVIRKATESAMEVTFASIPKQGTFGSALLKAYQAMPLLRTINPFPRFLANSYNFLIDYNPTGLVNLFLRDGEGKLLAANPAERAKILSRAMVGTTMLAGALGLRMSPAAGEKWYEIKTGDGRVVDTRAFAPFSTYLFLAEAIKQKGLGVKENALTTADWAQGLLSINRIAGTGLVGVDLLRAGTMDRGVKILQDFVAQYVGGFTVPFRTLKDLYAQFDPEEAKYRDVRGDVLGPAKANIPGVSQTLPEAPSPLREDTPESEMPLFSQLTGIGLRTKVPVEQEIQRLGIEFNKILPRTGLPDADRAIADAMGHLVDKSAPRLLNSPGYQRLSFEDQKLALENYFTAIRQEATKSLPGELLRQIRLHGLGDTMKNALRARGVVLP